MPNPNKAHPIHGHARRGKKSPEHFIWAAARQRCNNPNNKSFKNYGGRGITCNISFIVFFAEVGPRPSPRHTIERIDNERGYEPDNIRWATRTEQNANKRPRGPTKWNPRRKLTLEQVHAIRADTRTQRKIAADYGVTQSAISAIKSGKRWHHV